MKKLLIIVGFVAFMSGCSDGPYKLCSVGPYFEGNRYCDQREYYYWFDVRQTAVRLAKENEGTIFTIEKVQQKGGKFAILYKSYDYTVDGKFETTRDWEPES